METKTAIKLTVPIEIPYQRISDLVITAVEGGSNYWADIKIFDADGNRRRGLARFADDEQGCVGRCQIVFTDNEDPDNEHTLDLMDPALDQVVKAFQLMADTEKAPARHLKNFIDENEDAETADVFIQLALFGEIIFG